MIGQGVTLVTGLPGTGKTAHVVDLLSQIKDRPIFVMGIPELKIDHQPCPPVSEWVEFRADPDDPSLSLPYFAFPPNAVVVLDEAQRVYRPRTVGSKVPPEVAAFETRRHTGVDFVLLTQHPTFLDSNIRKLVSRHIHIHATFMGRYMLEWVGLGEPDDKASRALATRNKYAPPKRVFGLYKSAELHTKVVVRRPWYYYALPFVVLAVGSLAWYMYGRFKERAQGAEVVAAVASGGQSSSGKVSHKITTAQEYTAQYQPRLNGLLHTAPAYDELTQPQEVPIIAGCVERPKTGDCKCYDQRGNVYRTTPQVCHTFMSEGIFYAFRPPEPVRPAVVQREARSDAQAAPVPVSATSAPVPPPAPESVKTPPPVVPPDSPWRFKG